MSGLLIDDASQAKVCIFHMHKTANSVTIHATMKTKWFISFLLAKEGLVHMKVMILKPIPNSERPISRPALHSYMYQTF